MTQNIEEHVYIDNRNHKYVTRILPDSGITVKLDEQVENRFPTFLKDLNSDLINALQALPPSVHALVKRTCIWVNCSYRYGLLDKPRELYHSTVHHDKEWLISSHDDPQKVHGVEIYNCSEYQRSRLHWNGCGLILHEFCHLIHQFAVPGGLNNEKILKMFNSSKLNGKFQKVYRRDWAGRDIEHDMAYALVNHKEFFAEISVAFLCKAYEIIDDESRQIDHSSILYVTPPIVSPLVLVAVQKKYGRIASMHLQLPDSPYSSDEEEERDRENVNSLCGVSKYFRPCFVDDNKASVYTKGSISFCNKFFPFTCKQLQQHDSQLYQDVLSLWNDICIWVDDNEANDVISTMFCLRV